MPHWIILLDALSRRIWFKLSTLCLLVALVAALLGCAILAVRLFDAESRYTQNDGEPGRGEA
jgi:hypothetical protein